MGGRYLALLVEEAEDLADPPAEALTPAAHWAGLPRQRRSGVSRHAFRTLAHDARWLTRRSQGKQSPRAAIVARGAYFFAVLEDLLAARGGGVARDPPGRAGQQDEKAKEGEEQPCAD